MKTIIAICALSLAACAMQDAPTPPADAVCGNDLCESGENHSTCPADCDAGPVNPVCGNDVCENGETAASCLSDCDNGDPTCDPATWAAWSVKDDMYFAESTTADDGSEYWLCKGVLQEDGTYKAELVGDCAVEKADNGQSIAWLNPRTLTRQAGQPWHTTLSGDPQECHVTLHGCANPQVAADVGYCLPTWDAVTCPASPVGVNTEMSGPYTWFGDYLGSADGSSDLVGHFAFQRNPGGAAEPRGILTCGP